MLLGRLCISHEIAMEIEKNEQFKNEVIDALRRYIKHDWGELCKEDHVSNDMATVGEGRVLAAYPSCMGRIWIITEWDRSATTILFPSEY